MMVTVGSHLGFQVGYPAITRIRRDAAVWRPYATTRDKDGRATGLRQSRLGRRYLSSRSSARKPGGSIGATGRPLLCAGALFCRIEDVDGAHIYTLPIMFTRGSTKFAGFP